MGARDAVNEALLKTLSGNVAGDLSAREYAFSAQDFERVRKLIYARAGINLNETKQNMVYSRLSRRLRATGIDSFDDYLDRLENDARFSADENQEFVNALTTNLTSFFREPHHFPVLAEFLQTHCAQQGARLWCAAASTGEEPYSLAMTMIEALGQNTGARLLATDIDTNVLACSQRGVYRTDGIQACGEARIKRFFLRGKGSNDGMVRVRPELTRLIEFAQLNLLEEAYPVVRNFSQSLDVIFCRNVMIYFDKPTQRQILGRFAQLLRRGGLLFVGHSENFTDCREHWTLRGKTVYERI